MEPIRNRSAHGDPPVLLRSFSYIFLDFPRSRVTHIAFMSESVKDTVLVLDDAADTAVLMAKILEKEGYRCLVSNDPIDALDLLTREDILVVISDISMPKMKGTDFLKRARAALPDAELLLMTGLPDVKSAVEAIQSGASEYMLKPIAPDTVRNLVRKSLIVAKLRRDNRRYQMHLENLVSQRTNDLEKVTQLLIRGGEATVESVSREIHDGLGQSLLALKMDAQRLAGKMQDGKQQADLKGLVNQISLIIEECRSLSHRISPIANARLGLRRAITELAAKCAEKWGITIDLDLLPLDGYFERDWNVHLYRIVQEALTNAWRHSGGNHVEIGCRREDHNLIIWVKDNGKGMVEKHSAGIGLITMRQRASLSGGILDLQSTSEGVTITVKVSSGKSALYENPE